LPRLLDRHALSQADLDKAQGEYDASKAYPYTGKISFADPSFSQDTGSFMVRGVLPNPKMELRPGMSVTANLKDAMRPDAIVVPQSVIESFPNAFVRTRAARSLLAPSANTAVSGTVDWTRSFASAADWASSPAAASVTPSPGSIPEWA
jgi:multidrug efflux pump subunit AcrA (membrane-fusion protein)